MKVLFALPFIILGFCACKKEDKKSILQTVPTEIKYTIQPIDSNIIDVRFNGVNGVMVVQDGIGDFAGGSKIINVISKPFTAKVGLRFEDQPFSIDEYELSIFVNGTLKARDTIVNTSQSGMGEGYVEYVVE